MARIHQSSLIAVLVSIDLSLAHLLAAKIAFMVTGIPCLLAYHGVTFLPVPHVLL